MHEAQAYHFVGLDIHKRSVVFCEKTLTGQTVAHGTIGARKQELIAFAQSRGQPWVGAIEATLFSGWVYDVLAPYAVELHVGHPARLKPIFYSLLLGSLCFQGLTRKGRRCGTRFSVVS